MINKNKLGLTWIGKDERPRLEPRVLIEDKQKSYNISSGASRTENMLIRGDNLLALKALEAEHAGKVKCIYIDPPYNTGSAIPQYDDGLEHSIWLSLIRDRLEILRNLLSEDGSIWISIDDNECHYLKILMDEIFGRNNFVSTVIWQMIYTTKNTARHFSAMHDYILVYAKDKSIFNINLLPRSAKQDDAYKNPDGDLRGAWKATPLHARNFYGAGQYKIKSPSGRSISPPSGTFWRISENNFREMNADNRVWWGRDGSSVPSQKRFLTDVKQGVVPATLWLHDESGHNGEAKNEIRAIFGDGDETFLTPKPERLIKRILDIATRPGDIVLDSFAGTGTTAAVAHKMRRRWILVELGEHADTLIVPRMRKVIDGNDVGGVTESTGWKGGGGFRYCRLAPSLLSRDRYGQWVISKEYHPEMLAEAVCKLMGFAYAPSSEDETYWQHGYSTEMDFIFVTTQAMTYEALAKLSQEVGEDRTLLVACRAYSARDDAFPNITPKKIPLAVLAKCEWGRDDYSLSIKANPEPEVATDEEPPLASVASQRGRPKGKPAGGDATPTLFGEDA